MISANDWRKTSPKKRFQGFVILGSNKTLVEMVSQWDFLKKSQSIRMAVFQGLSKRYHKASLIGGIYFWLIPKKEDVKTIIPLVSSPCAHKILARLLFERLKYVLSHTITDYQFSFMNGKQIVDASLITNEINDDWKLRKRKGVIL